MSAPATIYALEVLERRSEFKRFVVDGIHSRHALLALAALADRDLTFTGAVGYVRADRVAGVVGLSASTMGRTLRGLARRPECGVVAVISRAALTEHVYGPELDRLARGARILGYRIAEAAYR